MTLLLASNPPPFADNADAPRWDVAELARVLNADVLYPPPKSGEIISVIENKTASDMRQAWAAFQRAETSVYVSLSEKVGVPLALLLRGQGKRNRAKHVLIAHNLTSPKKRALQARTRYLRDFDKIIVLCQTQADYLISEAGLSPERVCFVPDKVDSLWWTPCERNSDAGFVLAVGREKRDYPTLINAARLFPARPFVIVAASPWARGSKSGEAKNNAAPENVTFYAGLKWPALRASYCRASVVVVPLLAGTNYAAGVNAVLEAMAMAKPLIVSGTPGIADYVQDGETCRVVSPGNALALCAALTELQNPREAAQLGVNARNVIDKGRNLDTYVETIAKVVRGVSAP